MTWVFSRYSEKMEAKEIAQRETKHYTVLLAEDSAVARKIISDTMESAGHTVIAFRGRS